MKITILLFAGLREAVGANRVEVETFSGSTPQQIAITLAERYPRLRPHVATIAYAIDGEFVAADTQLTDAKELALLPPVSGG